MLKGFVSGEEKDIVRIPMKTRNLIDLESYLKRESVTYTKDGDTFTVDMKIALVQNPWYFSEEDMYVSISGIMTIPTGSNIRIYIVKRNGTISGSIALGGNGDIQKTVSVLGAGIKFDYAVSGTFTITNLMLNAGRLAADYEPYGYQEGWEVRDNEDRILWGREDELQTTTGTLPFKGYGLPLKSCEIEANMEQAASQQYSIEGTSSIDYQSDGTAITLQIVGNETQTGTPTPTVPITPSECGERTGNLFDGTYVEAIVQNDSFRYIETPNAKTTIIPVEPNTTYTLNKIDYSNRYNIAESATHPQNGDYLNVIQQGAQPNPTTFTTSSDTRWLTVYVSTGSESAEPRMMLNLGSTALPYEPYGYKIPFSNGQTSYNVYLTEPLRKIGDYGDTVSSDGTVVRRIKKQILDGTEDWTQNGTYTQYSVYIRPALVSNSVIMISSHFVGTTAGNIGLDGKISPSANGNKVMISHAASANPEEFKQFLASEYSAGHPVTIWYVLETSVSDTVTFPTVTPAQGANTLSVNTTLAPSKTLLTATSGVWPKNPIWPEMCGEKTGNLWDKGVPKYVYADDYKKYNSNNAIALKAGTYTLSSDNKLPIIQAFDANHTQLLVSGTITFPQTYYSQWDGLAIGPISNTVRSVTITLLSDCILTFAVSDNLGTYLMLNAGSQARPYEPYGWKIPFENHWENLVPTVDTANGWRKGYMVSGVYTSTQYYGEWLSPFISVADITSFTISAKQTDNPSMSVYWFNGETYISQTNDSDYSGSTFNSIPSDATKFCFAIRTGVNGNTPPDGWWVMLNLGSTPKPYSPYLNATIPVYLGEVPTVRRVKKLVLTGDSEFDIRKNYKDNPTNYLYYIRMGDDSVGARTCACSHLQFNSSGAPTDSVGCNANTPRVIYLNFGADIMNAQTSGNTVGGLKEYLASEYAAGHPVTIWYVLANEQTTISNEPLCKISTYADKLTIIQVHGLSAPLYGIGDYKDTLNLSTGVVTRKVKKHEFNGTETWATAGSSTSTFYYATVPTAPLQNTSAMCTHFEMALFSSSTYIRIYDKGVFQDVADFKAFLAAQYANGTPVTVWYVLNTPETETVTVPTGMTGEIEGYLTQVSTPTPTNRSVPKWNGVEETGGTYAVTVYTPPEIPTTTGQNTLTVKTILAPSKLTVKGHIKELT